MMMPPLSSNRIDVTAPGGILLVMMNFLRKKRQGIFLHNKFIRILHIIIHFS
jgi:hypothetical protein